MAKKMTDEKAFDLGFDLEQELADKIVKKLGTEDNQLSALMGAFHALTHRIAGIWEREYLLEVFSDALDIAEGVHKDHVCLDCAQKDAKGGTFH